jgi:hypothetical protein
LRGYSLFEIASQKIYIPFTTGLGRRSHAPCFWISKLLVPGNEIAHREVFTNMTRFAILENLYSCRSLLCLVALLALRNVAVPNPASADLPHHTGHVRNWAPAADDQLSKAAWDPTSTWADLITSTIVHALDDIHPHQSPPSSTASKMIEGTGKTTSITGVTMLKSVMK